MMKTLFTTGQVAKIWKAAPRTVSKWFDSGRLGGYRIPGSQDRRIPREHLLRFLLANGRPLSELEEPGCKIRIMCVSADAKIKEEMGRKKEFSVTSYEDSQTATQMLDTDFPMCVVIDYITVPDADDFRKWLVEGPWKGIINVIGIGRNGVTSHGELDAFYEVPAWEIVNAKAHELALAKYIRS